MKRLFFYFVLFFLFSESSSFFIREKELIINPYEDINWEKIKRYKANLHTHTNQSDGKLKPEEVISLYKNKNYSILSITDHNKCVYIYEKEIFLIPGIEIGENQHHILGYFKFQIPKNIENTNEETIIENISGISIFAHPGRYKKEVEWYVDLFKKYPNLVGIEVLNPSVQVKFGKIYGDTDIWDEILKRTMPEKPIWGFGNDDFHNLEHFSINWIEFLLYRLDEVEVKKAIKNGKFYICSAIKGYDMPFIKKIIFNKKKGEIKLECDNYKEIRWISDGEVVGHREKINYKENPDVKKYLRVEIYGKEGYIYLNPFGINEIISH
ncbi:MAG: PHP domain-containing protein [Candidatus Omnitrophica bacterium]|nr:PHP domain-containing protein [Candidatus Omnitrophota bacterium]